MFAASPPGTQNARIIRPWFAKATRSRDTHRSAVHQMPHAPSRAPVEYSSPSHDRQKPTHVCFLEFAVVSAQSSEYKEDTTPTTTSTMTKKWERESRNKLLGHFGSRGKRQTTSLTAHGCKSISQERGALQHSKNDKQT